MDQQITGRVSTLETDVAVIQSNYVRRDEFSALREEVGVGFAKVNAKIDFVHTELNGKIDLVHAELLGKMNGMHAELHGKIDLVHAELSAKMDVGFARLDARIDHAIATLLKWMFASQISVAAMFIAAIKYL
ncbi:hypothetical protein GJ698_23720 [Pseudoduganella sp. FT26W]|uniref:DUF1640 domain-containing protein n=1 Tax=Duganella aquatilis TaxID=2666082 RepID=A0A844D800_9BURK|nr:hypothetical protein [Duganella aquatilis]MRW87081.1 hypothetical protein [Duganella aquatilis]